MSLPDNLSRLAAIFLAINPEALKGVALHGTRNACESWLQYFASLTSPAPVRRVPANIPEERLLGGLDFAATIQKGHPVYERGLLAAADGGCIVLSASSTQRSTWQHVARTLDSSAVIVERDGFSEQQATTFAAIAFEDSDDVSALSFVERVAFLLELAHERIDDVGAVQELITLARGRVRNVRCDDGVFRVLCETALKLGIPSVRTALLAVAAARTCAAFHQRDDVNEDDVAVAAQLVFASRAVRLDDTTRVEESADGSTPNESKAHVLSQPRAQPPMDDLGDTSQSEPTSSVTENDAVLKETVIDAVRAALPAGVLATAAARARAKTGNSGRAGEDFTTGTRGRQTGTRKGLPRGGARLDIIATLRAAVPWQRIRRDGRISAKHSVIELRRDDFRVRKCVSPGTTTTLFVVDASGSSALHRLAEVKGAIELMLAEGYARRERVALIAFRGTQAELLLPPTHALARARRAVAGMPAGGGTPIASALDLTLRVVATLKRDPGRIVVVILSDGQANVGRDGQGGRVRANADALDAAQRLRSVHDHIVWIDSSARPYPQSKALADAMGARYVALPMVNATAVNDVARHALA